MYVLKDEIMNGFQHRWGFPQTVGAIDGTHIPILRPQESVSDNYYNEKGYHSLLMEAVVEHRSLFLDVNIGWPGKLHNTGVFVNFSFYLKVNVGTFFS